MKLDTMANVLNLMPVFAKSGKLKNKLATVSQHEIAAVHIICPASMECEDMNCKPFALAQDTCFWNIPKVTLIKGTTIYKRVSVLSGKCSHCDANYYADHEGLNQTSGRRNKIYLNSAKYIKLGHYIWIDPSFSNAVVNGIYSFHTSAATYTNYWNNTFGQVNLEYSAKLDRRHIWQAFVQESVRTIATDQDVYLELNENLPIDEVTKAAFTFLGQNGVMYAAKGHACAECSQSYRPPENENSDKNCESDLLNA